MARIKFGSIVTEGRGSLGGHTFQNSSGGVQLRTKPINNKKPSSAQSLIRSYNPHLQAGWRSLTDAQRDIWSRFATSHQICMLRDPDRPVCGHSLYMKYNFEYISRGLSLIASPYLMGPPYIGADIIKNGGFLTADNWNFYVNWSWSPGFANYLSGALSNFSQFLSLNSGFYYRLSFTIANCAGSAKFRIVDYQYHYIFSVPFNNILYLTDGHYSFDVACILNSDRIRFSAYADSPSFSITSISLRRLYY